MGKDICQQGVIFQYIQRTHTTQHQKNPKTTQLKHSKGPQQDFFFKEDIQMANRDEKKFNITNHKENINQNGNELSLHTCQNDYYPKDNK